MASCVMVSRPASAVPSLSCHLRAIFACRALSTVSLLALHRKLVKVAAVIMHLYSVQTICMRQDTRETVT